MPREPRDLQPGAVYHLISRVVERKFLITRSLERSIYLELHRKALKASDWTPLGYAIMSNHIHLAAIAGKQGLAEWIRPVHSPFADVINKQHERIGPVLVRGPKAFVVPNSRVGQLLAYIHNNPVRANLCGDASETNWTSHRAYLGLDDAPQWLDISTGVALSGVTRRDFNAWVNDPTQRADRSFSEEAHERELHQAEELDEAAARDEVAGTIVHATAAALEIPTSQVRGSSRGRREVVARAAAVHCASLFGVTGGGIASALNLSRQRVSVLRAQQPPNEALEVAARVYKRLRGAT